MQSYAFVVEGKRWANTFTVRGEIDAEPGNFTQVCRFALLQSFREVTEGTAEYGNPGTCDGPYTITKLTVELK